MGFEKQDLDMILVPSGLILMFGYHIFLLYRYLRLPEKTSHGARKSRQEGLGSRNIEGGEKGYEYFPICCINQRISSNILIISVPYIELTNWSLDKQFNRQFHPKRVNLRRHETDNYLNQIHLPPNLITEPSGVNEIPPKSVERAIVRGSDFWSVGHRALYFALDLLLWFFSPIPMFVGSVLMVALLYYLDYNSMPFHEHKFGGSEMVKTMEQGGAEVALAIQHQHHRE